MNTAGPPGTTVIGVGIDVVAVPRFAAALARTSALAARLFDPSELRTPSGGERTAASLAGRFAIKEAVAKALGVPRGMEWTDCQVVSGPAGRPELLTLGTVTAAAHAAGVTGWQISLSHDAGLAAAMVLALGAADFS